MKINLLLNDPDGVLHDFLNIDPFATERDPRLFGSVGNLDEFVEDAEASEILANDILDFLPPSDTDAVLAHWVRKLRHGGTLTLGGLDLREVGRLLTNQAIDLSAANVIIYGDQASPWACRKVALSLPLVADQLRRKGLSVVSKSCNGIFYRVVAKRP